MDAATDRLLDAARTVRQRAYSPYSRFKVGAALRTTDGDVFVGCNVENAAYPEGVCAEGGAISAMIAGTDGVPTIAEIVVVADADRPVTPCGGCRQKISELGGAGTVVHCVTLDGVTTTATLGELLPDSFGSDRLL